MSSTGLFEIFVAAVQASLSVLLVIFYGGVAAWLGLLNGASTKAVSKVCVRMFLPALLFTKIGAELHSGSAARYGVIVAWALVCHAVSFVLGIAGHLLLGMPDWTTVAIMFNNTTSYPLLLMSALAQTGILGELTRAAGLGDDEPAVHAAMERAKSYFLVFSTVSSCLTFAVGPRLIDSEHAPEPAVRTADGGDGDDDDDLSDDEEDKASEAEFVVTDTDANTGAAADAAADADAFADADDDDAADDAPLSRVVSQASSNCDPLVAAPPRRTPPAPRPANERTALLAPASASAAARNRSVVRFIDPFAASAFFPSTRKPTVDSRHDNNDNEANGSAATGAGTGAGAVRIAAAPLLNRRASVVPRHTWRRLGPQARWWLLFLGDFFNAPLLGALAGAAVGLTPRWHRAFFSSGGVFTAWLTASLDDIGGLFVPLPVVVAGVSLYTAMQEAKRRASSVAAAGGVVAPPLPRPTVAYILAARFVLWPVAAIAVVSQLAARTTLLGDDPILWFALMLMPTGPSAMKLITLVQVSNAHPAEETSIAKLLTVSYLISPVLSFAVVASLRASLAVAGP